MVEKKEGALMTCKCGTELTCRTKDYGGGFAPKLQWQNEDGTAHYSTKDGKTFSCNIPEDKSDIPNESKAPTPDEYLKNKQAQIKQESKTQQESIKQQTNSFFDETKLFQIDSEIDKLLIIEDMVTKKLRIPGISPNPAKVGMYMKFIYEELKTQK